MVFFIYTILPTAVKFHSTISGPSQYTYLIKFGLPHLDHNVSLYEMLPLIINEQIHLYNIYGSHPGIVQVVIIVEICEHAYERFMCKSLTLSFCGLVNISSTPWVGIPTTA